MHQVHLSKEAARLIQTLIASSPSPAKALRLGTDDHSHCLHMELAMEPHDNDFILRQNGATLFVSPRAADRLTRRRLHASADGPPAFYIDS